MECVHNLYWCPLGVRVGIVLKYITYEAGDSVEPRGLKCYRKREPPRRGHRCRVGEAESDV